MTTGGALELQAIRVVAQPLYSGRGQEPVVGEGLVPFGKIKIACDSGGRSLVALGDEIVQILVCRWT